VYINGVYSGAPSGYTFNNVTINYTIHVVFAINIYQITASSGAHGSITPSGVTDVIHGHTQGFSIIPDGGYQIGMVVVDGVDVGTPAFQEFTNVTADHTIGAYFADDSTSLTLVGKRWNIVSVPSLVGDYSKTTLFPSATTAAFNFDGSYQTAAVMENGPGYWLKFESAEVIALVGTQLTVDTFDVAQGWNMIGSISEPVPVGNITSIPPGIVTSQFFGYGTGYSVSPSIVPCRGYWVKVAEAGQLVLSSNPAALPASRIRIVPTDEMPPPPPAEQEAGTDRIVPEAYSLDQNYPNPFNPTTTIGYGLPAGGDVSVDIFNLLGERVARFEEGYREAGVHSFVWNAAGLPGGVYFYRFRSGSFTTMKKMILLK